MATSLTGPWLEFMALATAPFPRPPQPISARRIVLSSAAWTLGIVAPASVTPAAMLPVWAKKLRRDRPFGREADNCGSRFMVGCPSGMRDAGYGMLVVYSVLLIGGAGPVQMLLQEGIIRALLC